MEVKTKKRSGPKPLRFFVLQFIVSHGTVRTYASPLALLYHKVKTISSIFQKAVLYAYPLCQATFRAVGDASPYNITPVLYVPNGV